MKYTKMRHTFFVLFFLLFSTLGNAQRYLPGLWQGTLIQGDEEYPIEIFIVRNRQKLSGRTYIYLGDQETVEAEINGRLHKDLSMNLLESRIVHPEVPDDSLHFLHHFQLIYTRSFNDLELRGHWQDWKHNPTDPKRRRGTLTLKRKASKA